MRGGQSESLGLVVMNEEENMQDRPEQIMHVAQQEEKYRELLNLDQNECFLQEELDEGRSPHEDTGGQREPLVVGDCLVHSVPHRQGDEEVEGYRDEDRSEETDEEKKEKIIFEEFLLHHTFLVLLSLLIINYLVLITLRVNMISP